MHLPVLFWWRCEFACDAGQFFESNRGVSSTWTTFVPSIMGPDRWTPWQGDGRQQGSLVYPVGGVLLPKMFWHMWCLCGVAAPGGSRILNMCVDQNCLEFYDGVCLHLYASGSWSGTWLFLSSALRGAPSTCQSFDQKWTCW